MITKRLNTLLFITFFFSACFEQGGPSSEAPYEQSPLWTQSGEEGEGISYGRLRRSDVVRCDLSSSFVGFDGSPFSVPPRGEIRKGRTRLPRSPFSVPPRGSPPPLGFQAGDGAGSSCADRPRRPGVVRCELDSPFVGFDGTPPAGSCKITGISEAAKAEARFELRSDGGCSGLSVDPLSGSLGGVVVLEEMRATCVVAVSYFDDCHQPKQAARLVLKKPRLRLRADSRKKDPTVEVGEKASLVFTASGSRNQPLAIEQGELSCVSINGSACPQEVSFENSSFKWTPKSPGEYAVVVRLQKGQLSAEASARLIALAGDEPYCPSGQSLTCSHATVRTFEREVPAISCNVDGYFNPEGTPPRYELSGDCDGLSIDPSNGIITGSLSMAFDTSCIARVTASDGCTMATLEHEVVFHLDIDPDAPPAFAEGAQIELGFIQPEIQYRDNYSLVDEWGGWRSFDVGVQFMTFDGADGTTTIQFSDFAMDTAFRDQLRRYAVGDFIDIPISCGDGSGATLPRQTIIYELIDVQPNDLMVLRDHSKLTEPCYSTAGAPYYFRVHDFVEVPAYHPSGVIGDELAVLGELPEATIGVGISYAQLWDCSFDGSFEDDCTIPQASLSNDSLSMTVSEQTAGAWIRLRHRAETDNGVAELEATYQLTGAGKVLRINPVLNSLMNFAVVGDLIVAIGQDTFNSGEGNQIVVYDPASGRSQWHNLRSGSGSSVFNRGLTEFQGRALASIWDPDRSFYAIGFFDPLDGSVDFPSGSIRLEGLGNDFRLAPNGDVILAGDDMTNYRRQLYRFDGQSVNILDNLTGNTLGWEVADHQAIGNWVYSVRHSSPQGARLLRRTNLSTGQSTYVQQSGDFLTTANGNTVSLNVLIVNGEQRLITRTRPLNNNTVPFTLDTFGENGSRTSTVSIPGQVANDTLFPIVTHADRAYTRTGSGGINLTRYNGVTNQVDVLWYGSTTYRPQTLLAATASAIYMTYLEDGKYFVGRYDIATGQIENLGGDFTQVELRWIIPRVIDDRLYFTVRSSEDSSQSLYVTKME